MTQYWFNDHWGPLIVRLTLDADGTTETSHCYVVLPQENT